MGIHPGAAPGSALIPVDTNNISRFWIFACVIAKLLTNLTNTLFAAPKLCELGTWLLAKITVSSGVWMRI